MSTSLPHLVGANLKDLRERKGWTQACAAENVGVKPVTYANMETGRKNPTLRQVARYARAFHVDPADLFLPVSTA